MAQLNIKLLAIDDNLIKTLLKESFKGRTKSSLIIALIRFINDVERNARINGDIDDKELIKLINKIARDYDSIQKARSGKPLLD